jgi:hypothetical protein
MNMSVCIGPRPLLCMYLQKKSLHRIHNTSHKLLNLD